jgi:hypothetical protein
MLNRVRLRNTSSSQRRVAPSAVALFEIGNRFAVADEHHCPNPPPDIPGWPSAAPLPALGANHSLNYEAGMHLRGLIGKTIGTNGLKALQAVIERAGQTITAI